MLSLLLALSIDREPTPAERTAIFTAAGFHQRGAKWSSDCENPASEAYVAGAIEGFSDINGDGRPEAIVTESGAFCYGAAGFGFTLLTSSASGEWTRLYASPGLATVMATSATGWPDIEIGGPGFCFPILRWTGTAYAIHHHAYEGKACKP